LCAGALHESAIKTEDHAGTSKIIMPVLPNPKHEAFAQAIFNGIVGAKGGASSQAEAYRRAGYRVTNGNSARACASRLLTFAKASASASKNFKPLPRRILSRAQTNVFANLTSSELQQKQKKPMAPRFLQSWEKLRSLT
jgi:hypothetical protein